MEGGWCRSPFFSDSPLPLFPAQPRSPCPAVPFSADTLATWYKDCSSLFTLVSLWCLGCSFLSRNFFLRSLLGIVPLAQPAQSFLCLIVKSDVPGYLDRALLLTCGSTFLLCDLSGPRALLLPGTLSPGPTLAGLVASPAGYLSSPLGGPFDDSRHLKEGSSGLPVAGATWSLISTAGCQGLAQCSWAVYSEGTSLNASLRPTPVLGRCWSQGLSG